MAIKLENVGIAVRDLDAAIAFFTDLGLTVVGRDTVSGEWTDTGVGGFILFSLLTAGIALIQERRNFTLLRLMTTRLRRWEIIAGKAAGMFALTFVQQIILIGAGQLLFGVDYLRDPAALLLMMVALCFALCLVPVAMTRSIHPAPLHPAPLEPGVRTGSRCRGCPGRGRARAVHS